MKAIWNWINRQLLFLIFIGLWVLIMLFINFNVKVAQNAADTRIIAQETKVIAEQAKVLADQNKALSEQNRAIGNANTAHIDCVTELFAQYTRDNKPITIEDEATCKASEASGVSTSPQTPSTPAPAPTTTPTSQAPQTAPTKQPNGIQKFFNGVKDNVNKFIRALGA